MRRLTGITDLMDMNLSKLWVGDEHWSLVCFSSPRVLKELDTTEWLNWAEVIPTIIIYIVSFFETYIIRIIICYWIQNYMELPRWWNSKASAYQLRRKKRCRLIPGSGKSPRVGNAIQSSILVWTFQVQWVLVNYTHGVTELNMSEHMN